MNRRTFMAAVGAALAAAGLPAVAEAYGPPSLGDWLNCLEIEARAAMRNAPGGVKWPGTMRCCEYADSWEFRVTYDVGEHECFGVVWADHERYIDWRGASLTRRAQLLANWRAEVEGLIEWVGDNIRYNHVPGLDVHPPADARTWLVDPADCQKFQVGEVWRSAGEGGVIVSRIVAIDYAKGEITVSA